MALTIETTTDAKIDLDEFQEYLRANFDSADPESAIAAAEPLRALANNERFLTDRLNSDLLKGDDFQIGNDYTAQTFVLASHRNWFVRANIWTPPSNIPEMIAAEKELFPYLVPHDHNFSFLTVGYWGSGYWTRLYEYDPTSVTGEPGEKVDLHYVGRTSLTRGKVMHYRASKDIHSQEHPEEFSVSLNLMIARPEEYARDQYFFDLESETISKVSGKQNSGGVLICEMAGVIGDSTTAAALDALSATHGSARVRAACYTSLAKLEPSSVEQVWNRALSDPHAYVRKTALHTLQSSCANR
jgi:hypothetical protein